MSEQQQPKEYIITEEQLLDLIACSGDGFQRVMLKNTAKAIEAEIRSRPHPAPQAPIETLTEKESLLLAAGLCAGSIAAGTPEVFDGIQLSPRLQKNPVAQKKFAEAALLIVGNLEEYHIAIDKASRIYSAPESNDEHDAAIERKAREVFATTLKKRLRKTWEDAKEMSDDPEWEENHSFSLLYLENEIDESLRQQDGDQHE